jgi:hypothetical protein
MAGGGRGGGQGGAGQGAGKAVSNQGQKQGQSAAATQAQGQGQASTLNQVFPAAETLGGNFLSQAGMSQQGMFPMVPPGMWNVPLEQWQQLFAQPGMGQMM